MQKLSSFKSFLTEVKMSPDQWNKPNSQTGEPRLEILARLVQKKVPLELDAGGTFVVTKISDALAAITKFKREGKTFELIGKIDGKGKEVVIKSSDLKKSKDFGGDNGGKTGGTVGTALAESAQCYYCSAVCNVLGSASSPEKFTPAVLKKAAKYVNADVSLEEVQASLSEDWELSSITTANILFNEGYIVKGHEFFRGKGKMLDIYKMAKSAYKAGGQEALPADKWNPGDIWACKSSFIPSSLDTSNIEAYNADLLDAFLTRECVGISLKKVTNTAHITRYNIEPSKEINKYHGFSLSSSKKPGSIDNFFSSNSIGLHINDSFMEVRPFSFQSDYAFEISAAAGGHARGGRIKLKDFNIAVKKEGGHEVSEADAKTHANKFDVKKGTLDVPFLKGWWKIVNEINPHGHITYNDFEQRVKDKIKSDGEKAKNWLYGKYIGTQVIYSVESLGPKKAGKALGALLRIAASSTDTSSAFIKVS